MRIAYKIVGRPMAFLGYLKIDGVDIRGEGGHVLATPTTLIYNCMHDGKVYRGSCDLLDASSEHGVTALHGRGKDGHVVILVKEDFESFEILV